MRIRLDTPLRLLTSVDAAIDEYQAWCDRNRPEGGEDR